MYSFKRDEYYDENGLPIINSISLEKGLYNFLLIGDKGKYLPGIVEVDEDKNLETSYADFFEAYIYPVHTENVTSLTTNMSANASLKVNYTIKDEAGKTHYQNNVSIRSGENIDLKIPVDNLPAGYLFHKFVFDDGSELKKTTIKN